MAVRFAAGCADRTRRQDQALHRGPGPGHRGRDVFNCTGQPTMLEIAIAIGIVLVTFALIVYYCNGKFYAMPTPAEVLERAPPRSFLKQDHLMQRRRVRPDYQADLDLIETVTAAIISTMEDHLKDGSQLGMSISVYFKGCEIANVCGGLYRSLVSNELQPVTPDTLFMAYRYLNKPPQIPVIFS
jgi:hypothetical protein